LSITRCFGIGCPLRNECARFGVHGQKIFPYIEEAYNFVAGECANQVKRKAVEVADE
jgi:hypothetical protein